MVCMDPTSIRKGMNGKPVSLQFKRQRKMNANRKYRSTFTASPEAARRSFLTFRVKQTPFDVQASQAVKQAQQKLAAKCLHPVGYRILLATLTAAERKQKPSKVGDKCIAMPHGQPLGGNHLAAWCPCTFEAESYPNGVDYTFFILRRTALMMSADKRLSELFVVKSTDCFLVPRSFTAAFGLNFMPNDGVYVIENMFGDIYVGKSKDIAKRVGFHNRGQGASFTTGKGKWWRINPIARPPTAAQQRYSQESVEMLNQVERVGCAKKVRGGFRTDKDNPPKKRKTVD